MSFYEYDPYCDFYYYDDCPNFDFYVEEPVVDDHRIEKKKKRRPKHSFINKSLDRTLSDEDCLCSYQQSSKSPKYLVPIFYAPTKISDTRKLDTEIQENIDLYYSDKRNIEKEARLFHTYARPSFYASTIQEETESSTCIESCTFNDDFQEPRHEKRVLISHKINRADMPEKWHDCGYKIHKVKKKVKAPQNIVVGSGKKPKPRSHPYKTDKLETSNSWTTLLSGSCITNKDFKMAEVKKQSNDISCNSPIKRSISVISFHEKSKTSVKFNVNCDGSLKKVDQNAQTELQAERDTNQIPIEESMKNQTYQSVSNVQSMATPNNKITTEMVGWKNTTMQQDSTTTESSKLSCSQEIKSNPILPDTSDCTDITVNTAEYKEFLKSMNKLPKAHNIPYHRYPNYNRSVDTITEKSCDIKYTVPVNSQVSSDTFCDKIMYPKRIDEETQHYKGRVNPLIDVPLGISKNALYSPAFLVCDQPKLIKDENDGSAICRPKSFLVRIFRRVADLVASFQNYAYKYILRFILFI